MAAEVKVHPEVIAALNKALKGELTAINQYFLHARMLDDWGYKKRGKAEYHEAIEEMQHADKLIERILYFDGLPNMQRLNPVMVGENVVEQHKVDLELEYSNVARLNAAIQLCLDKRDGGVD